VEVVLGEKMKRTEDLVIFELEALGGLEVPHVHVVFGVLRDRLWTPLDLELLLTVCILRRRDARTPAGPAVVVVRVRRVGRDGLRIVRGAVVEA